MFKAFSSVYLPPVWVWTQHVGVGVCLTGLGVCDGSLWGPRPGLHVASLLQSEDETPITDHHLPRIQALNDTLWEQRDARQPCS